MCFPLSSPCRRRRRRVPASAVGFYKRLAVPQVLTYPYVLSKIKLQVPCRLAHPHTHTHHHHHHGNHTHMCTVHTAPLAAHCSVSPARPLPELAGWGRREEADRELAADGHLEEKRARRMVHRLVPTGENILRLTVRRLRPPPAAATSRNQPPQPQQQPQQQQFRIPVPPSHLLDSSPTWLPTDAAASTDPYSVLPSRRRRSSTQS